MTEPLLQGRGQVGILRLQGSNQGIELPVSFAEFLPARQTVEVGMEGQSQIVRIAFLPGAVQEAPKGFSLAGGGSQDALRGPPNFSGVGSHRL